MQKDKVVGDVKFLRGNDLQDVFNIKKYAGKWFEISRKRHPESLEKGIDNGVPLTPYVADDATDITATYTLVVDKDKHHAIAIKNTATQKDVDGTPKLIDIVGFGMPTEEWSASSGCFYLDFTQLSVEFVSSIPFPTPSNVQRTQMTTTQPPPAAGGVGTITSYSYKSAPNTGGARYQIHVVLKNRKTGDYMAAIVSGGAPYDMSPVWILARDPHFADRHRAHYHKLLNMAFDLGLVRKETCLLMADAKGQTKQTIV